MGNSESSTPNIGGSGSSIRTEDPATSPQNGVPHKPPNMLASGSHFEPLKEEDSSSFRNKNSKRQNPAAKDRNTASTTASPFSSEGSSNSIPIPSLHGSLLRTHKRRDPLRFYSIIKVLGDGSMGSVSKVEKRQSAVGGSSRRSFVKRERRLKVCFGLLEMCGSGLFCPIKSESDSKESDPTQQRKNVLLEPSQATTNSSMQTIEEQSETSAGPPDGETASTDHFNQGLPDPNARKRTYAATKSSSMISFGEQKDVFYALKSIHLERCRDSTFREELLNEIAILQRLDHPHIVKAMETFDYKDRLYLVLELCSGGDLYARDPYSEMESCRIVHSVMDAVVYMHSKGITHRDLKFENIMFSSPNSNSVKVIDFGLSRKYSQEEHLHDTVGTVYTMAPEVLKGDYDNKCDVWSMGVIAFMLLSSSLPFYGKTRQHVVRKIVNGKYGFKSHRWKPISPMAKEFVMECLVPKPFTRKSAKAMLQHPFIKRGEDASEAQVPFPLMDRVQATIQTFCEYQRLKKLALLVVAHRSTDEEIGFLRKVFDVFDSGHHDGEITAVEFKEALTVYQYDEHDMDRMFAGMDLDGTGSVHYSEFLAATIEAHGSISEQRIAEAFDRLDSDDSGYITVHNIVDFLGDSISEEYVDAIIDEADITRDHRISYNEFLSLWNETSDTKFKKALEDVNYRRASFDDDSFDDEDAGATYASFASSDAGISANSSDLGGGSFFFGKEKGKSIRGVWV